ncbi:hypothetical protein [Flavobacterium sp.]|nr:hypothetical protein [Flavobacterium sp.]
MKLFFAKCYWLAYKRAVRRAEPDTPKGFVLRELLYNVVRFVVRYYKP